MRFWTIWTLRACTIQEKLRRTRDWAAMMVALKLPLRVRYWTTMQEIAHATRDSQNIPATPLDEILKGLRAPRSVL